jgi:excisionase family DNA binding protein
MPPTRDITPRKIAAARRGANELRPLAKAARRHAQAVTIATKGARVVLDAEIVAGMVDFIDSMPDALGDEQELTPNEAAEILRMSRPSVMRLVETGALSARMVGSHHRLSRTEVLAYRDRESRARRRALTNLARLTDEHDF